MNNITYAIQVFICSKKDIFLLNEVKEEKEEMNKVNDLYDINYYIKRKQKMISRATEKFNT
jgi:hypothetical protein